MSPPFVPSMLDPIVAAFSPHRAQQQKEARNKVSYAAASRTRLQVRRRMGCCVVEGCSCV
jgi:hypothetical protein